jgi:hypothetical protein
METQPTLSYAICNVMKLVIGSQEKMMVIQRLAQIYAHNHLMTTHQVGINQPM